MIHPEEGSSESIDFEDEEFNCSEIWQRAESNPTASVQLVRAMRTKMQAGDELD